MLFRSQKLYLSNLNATKKITDYDSLKRKLYDAFANKNKYTYEIETEKGKHWKELSPGWKTAILIELILNNSKDIAPIIIDQPEDNLTNNYINNKLIEDIKKSKNNRQIIVVTHNATIPIMADAQNIILCQNDNKLIEIKSGLLEEKINNIRVLDYIANITDGGKASITKRFKKYNIKSYKED